MSEEPVIWTVSEVNHAVREQIEGAFAPFWMTGEIGSLALQRSGHAYFTLKDRSSQMRAVYFGGARNVESLQLGNGAKIECYGNLSVYEARGEYQFSVRALRPAGLGDLQKKFEELKQKLAAEGLFDASRKRPVPLLPEHIGVVTSPGGAAIRDFLQIINRRFPNVNVKIYPCPVQGAGAGKAVAAGVEFFNRANSVDVIVVTRGGGSMEDLWEFNDENLARTVAGSRIPVISAVGHEIDFTICDFAADLRVPTPSAAAELVIGKRQELAERLNRAAKDGRNVLLFALQELRTRFDRAAGSFVFREPMHHVQMKSQLLDEFDVRIRNAAVNRSAAVRNRLQQIDFQLKNAASAADCACRSRLERLENVLAALNPHRQLERGYSMIFDRDTGKLLCARADVVPGRKLSVRLADGTAPVTAD